MQSPGALAPGLTSCTRAPNLLAMSTLVCMRAVVTTGTRPSTRKICYGHAESTTSCDATTFCVYAIKGESSWTTACAPFCLCTARAPFYFWHGHSRAWTIGTRASCSRHVHKGCLSCRRPAHACRRPAHACWRLRTRAGGTCARVPVALVLVPAVRVGGPAASARVPRHLRSRAGGT